MKEDRKLNKNGNHYYANFSEDQEIIEFEIVVSETGVDMHYCDHIVANYNIEKDRISYELSYDPYEKRRELRNIRQIINDEDNKETLGSHHLITDKMVSKLEESFKIKYTDLVNHCYVQSSSEVTGQLKTDYEILVLENEYLVLNKEEKEKSYNFEELYNFLDSNNYNPITNFDNCAYDIRNLEDEITRGKTKWL